MRSAVALPGLFCLVSACATTGRAPGASFPVPVGDASVGAFDPGLLVPARSARDPQEMEEKEREPWINVFSFVSGRELQKVTFENDNTDIETDASNVETTRTGVGVAFGLREVQGYVQAFVENMEGEFDALQPDLDADGIGFGGGVMGEPWIATFDESTHLILPYRVDVGVVLADDDDLEIDLLYYDARVEAGVGVDWNGLQPSIGARFDTLVGGVEAEDDINEDAFDAVFAGFNAGVYAGLEYKHPEFPLWFDVRASGGDVEGVTGTIGFTL